MCTKISDRLTKKLSSIKNGNYTRSDFIIADAKDADMGGGINGLGFKVDKNGNKKAKTAAEYRASMIEMMEADLVDIMLTSMWSADELTAQKAFDNRDITAAVRLNDATDIWGFRGAKYREFPAEPFRTARLKKARELCELGLYAITFYNNQKIDTAMLNAYCDFREEANKFGMLHFLEVFNPAFDIDTANTNLGTFINDAITRCLAGVAKTERPLFLKLQYNGARAMEELASFDPANLIVGVLGGAAGTTRDTFELLAQSERFGGRVALFGRKIYGAEDAVEIVRLMRAVVENGLSTREAVTAYHDSLTKKNVVAQRSLLEDLEVTDPTLKPEAE